MREYRALHYLEKIHKKAYICTKPSSVERPCHRRVVGPSPLGPMAWQRSAAMPTSPKMEIRSKKSQRYLTSSVLEERHAKKKLQVTPSVVFPSPVAALLVITPPVPTPSAPASKDKGRALVIPPVRRCLLFTIEGKLMAGAHVLDSYQYFPKASPQRRRL